MATVLRPEKYSFIPATRQVTFNLSDFDIRKVVSIVNRSSGKIIYAPAMGTGYLGTINLRTLTLDYDTTAMAASDLLDIIYDWEVGYSTSCEILHHTAMASGADPLYQTVVCTGTGMTVSQASGKLVVAMGTSTNTETIIRSNIAYSYDVTASWQVLRSQVNANNNIYTMLADIIGETLAVTTTSATVANVTIPVDNQYYAQFARILTVSATGMNGMKMFMGNLTTITGATGQFTIASAVLNAGVSVVLTFTVAGFSTATGTCMLYGWNALYLLQTPATATTATFDTLRFGWTSGMGASTPTVSTTLSPGAGFAISKNDNLANLSHGVLTSGLPITVVASRCDGLPLKEIPLYFIMVFRNGGSAPTATTVTTSGIRIEETDAPPVTITETRLPRSTATAIPVVFPATQTVSISGTVTTAALAAGTNLAADTGRQYRANATGAANSVTIIATASTNAASVKAASGRVLGWNICNNNETATLYVKLHNITTVPVAGTAVARTIAIPPRSVNSFSLEGGLGFSTGIGLTTVTGFALADATPLAADGDLVGTLFFA